MSIPNPRTLVRDLAAAITQHDHFARNGSGLIYVYCDGVYRPTGEMRIRQQVKHLLIDHDCPEMWSRALAKEVVEFIALDVDELRRKLLRIRRLFDPKGSAVASWSFQRYLTAHAHEYLRGWS